ncbi:MAG TPA: response regulator [bacterium]|nr:response regulator [bacterium]
MSKQGHEDKNIVLIVDDAGIVRMACERALSKAGFEVHTADGGTEALVKLQNQAFHVALLDLKMPGMSGLDLMRVMREMWPKTEVVIMTAYSDNIMIEQTRRLGAVDVILKPFDDIRRLARTVAKAALRSRLRRKDHVNSEQMMRAILVEPGWVSEPEFEKARARMNDERGSIRDALLASGAISDADMDWAFASFLDVPFVHLDAQMLDPEIVRQFPAALARKFQCLPLFREDGTWHVVIADPFNDEARREIEAFLDAPVTFYKGNAPELDEAMAVFDAPGPHQLAAAGTEQTSARGPAGPATTKDAR